MGTVVISALDIGSALIGGLLVHFAPKIVSAGDKSSLAGDPDVQAAKGRFRAKIEEFLTAIGL